MSGLEKQFCSGWESWDQVDTWALQFNNAVLLPHVAAIVGREVADCMTVCTEDCKVCFWWEDGTENEFTFSAQIVVDKE